MTTEKWNKFEEFFDINPLAKLEIFTDFVKHVFYLYTLAVTRRGFEKTELNSKEKASLRGMHRAWQDTRRFSKVNFERTNKIIYFSFT